MRKNRARSTLIDMKLKVELIWGGGVLVEGDDPAAPGAIYYLVDADTGESLCDIDFDTHEKLESYIAAHFPGCERWVPPPPPADEAARLAKFLEMHDSGSLDNPHIKKVVRNFLVNQLYQSGYPEETVARIRTVIAQLA